MILRRIATAFKRQDWAMVLIEFVLVIAGVLVALQANNSNEARKDRALERIYLARLHSDLEQSITLNQLYLTSMLESRDEASFVIDALETCSLAPDMRDRFATSLFRLGKYSPPSLIDTTLFEMQSAGTLGLISDPALVQALIDLQRSFERISNIIFSSTTLWTADQIALLNRRAQYNFVDLRGGFGPVRWEELSFDFEEACTDEALIAAIKTIRTSTIEMARRNEREIARIGETRTTLETVMDNKIPGWRETP